jgi:putative endonuclease
MNSYNKVMGNLGEKAAANFLSYHGHTILCRNYRGQSGEIDIISKKDGCLIFTEVKTRSSLNYGFPCDSVTPHKMKKIVDTAAEYLSVNGFDTDIRFDVVEVYANLKNGRFLIEKINHIENAICDACLAGAA